MAVEKAVSIFWFRRDLRLHDNAGLYRALKSGHKVLPVFIFDTEILDPLPSGYDRRVDFIHQALQQLNRELAAFGSALNVYHGKPLDAFAALVRAYKIDCLYTNHDYEPVAIKRDEAVAAYLAAQQIGFKSYKDQCIFEKDEVVKDDGKPYTVFTPYSVRWKKELLPFHYKPYPLDKYSTGFISQKGRPLPGLKTLGFEKTDIVYRPDPGLEPSLLKQYEEKRDYPALAGTSRLSMHLRFGTVSIRQLAAKALKHSETWLNELIWRDFYMMILWHFPHAASQAFKKNYERIQWRNNETAFGKWCAGQTGFPIVDAGMRELNQTGFMHNRVRMIVSSFLVKDLLIDWRWGEAYFAAKLNDFDLSANNGGWQWAAGSGCDAAPYFRIFNPSEQQKKFDPDLTYIRRWVAEFDTPDYPAPIVDHAQARLQALAAYKKALSPDGQTRLFK